jgi:hypothetical protein
MMKDPNKQARLAARKCFKPYLSEQQLSYAMRILEQGYHIDSATSLIAYVKKIATEFGINEATRKTLHIQLHQLLSSPVEIEDEPEDDLQPPIDMPSSSVTQPPISSEEPIAAPITTEEQELQDPTKIAVPPHVALFTILIKQIGKSCSIQELLMIVTDIVDSNNPRSKPIIQALKQWQMQSDNFEWAINLDESLLIGLVHTLYTAVCELQGPVEADHLFHTALTVCEKHPEAKLFSPSRFF